MSATDDTSTPQTRPSTLVAAAFLVALEALVFVGLAVAEIAAFESEKAVMGASTTLFFLVYGAGLAFAAWGVWRLRSWGRAPIVVAQVIQLLVAGSFWGGQTRWVAVVLAVVAVLVLAGIFHPRSTKALAAAD